MDNSMVKSAKERVAWIDWCRAFAICSVLMCHSSERVYVFSLPEFGEYYLRRQLAALIIHTIGRLGVPIFFFVSGYLLLDRSYDYKNTKTFYRKNLGGLILSVEIWIIIYNFFNVYFYEQPFNLNTLLRNMLFL